MAVGRRYGFNFVKQYARPTVRHPFFISKRYQTVAVGQQPNFSDMFTYLTNNTLHTKLNKISAYHPSCIQLLNTIKLGDPNNDVFYEPDCALFLLALMRENKISFNQGISIYHYLMCLMNFTDSLPLPDKHRDFKTCRTLSVLSFSHAGKLTSIGEKYLEETCAKFSKFDYYLDFEVCRDAILKLPASEQWLLAIQYDPAQFSGFDHMITLLTSTVPFLVTIDGVSYQPSLSVLNFFLQQMRQNPIRIQPGFGCINDADFLKLHSLGIHPIALYYPAACDSMLEAHGIACGPVGVFNHDWAHAFWMNLFNEQEFKIIFNEYVPELQRLLALAKHIGWSTHADCAEYAQKKLIDFDLSDINEFYCPTTRLANYLNPIKKIINVLTENLAEKSNLHTTRP